VAEGWLEDDESLRAARDRGAELGCSATSKATAALLTLLAATLHAKAVVEIGTGTGVSGAALLAGMAPGGVLTSIDVEAEHQRLAKDTLTALGYDHVQMRLIAGRALDVLPRLSDGAYDLLFADGDRTEYPAVLKQARRLLRPGGIVVFDHVLDEQGLADSSARDSESAAIREVAASLRDQDDWLPALLTVGSGLLVGALRAPVEQD
jgi:predicted O-methyltransferase YrrM